MAEERERHGLNDGTTVVRFKLDDVEGATEEFGELSKSEQILISELEQNHYSNEAIITTIRYLRDNGYDEMIDNGAYQQYLDSESTSADLRERIGGVSYQEKLVAGLLHCYGFSDQEIADSISYYRQNTSFERVIIDDTLVSGDEEALATSLLQEGLPAKEVMTSIQYLREPKGVEYNENATFVLEDADAVVQEQLKTLSDSEQSVADIMKKNGRTDEEVVNAIQYLREQPEGVEYNENATFVLEDATATIQEQLKTLSDSEQSVADIMKKNGRTDKEVLDAIQYLRKPKEVEYDEDATFVLEDADDAVQEQLKTLSDSEQSVADIMKKNGRTDEEVVNAIQYLRRNMPYKMDEATTEEFGPLTYDEQEIANTLKKAGHSDETIVESLRWLKENGDTNHLYTDVQFDPSSLLEGDAAALGALTTEEKKLADQLKQHGISDIDIASSIINLREKAKENANGADIDSSNIDPLTGLPYGELLPVDPNDPPDYVDTTALGQDVPVYSDDPRLVYTAGNEFASLKGGRIKDGRIRDSGMVPLGESKKTWQDDMEDKNSELRRTLRANGFFMPDDMRMNEGFYRYPRIDPYNYVDGAKEYIFFTKPDLPLLKDATSLIQPADKIPYFAHLMESEGYRKSVFYNLCASAAAQAGDIHKCPFIRILSNRKTSNMDIPDIQVDELESAVNMYGTKILYPKSSQASDEGVDFSIEFEDTRFCEIYHLWKVYDIYRQLKWKGVLGPTVNLGRYDMGAEEGLLGALGDRWRNLETIVKNVFGLGESALPGTTGSAAGYNLYNNYTYYKILYDHFSVFKFLVGSDGETILFMAKATGVYARSISRSSFSEIPDRGPLKITVGFKVSGWFEDSTPEIVADFNELVKAWVGKDPIAALKEKPAPIYDYDIDYVSQELVKCPVIYETPAIAKGQEYANLTRLHEFNTYKLGWIKMD